MCRPLPPFYPDGPPSSDVQVPTFLHTSVHIECRTDLEPSGDVARKARLWTRTRLTLMRWQGDVEEASLVAGWLGDNAVKYGSDPQRPGMPLGLAVAITADGELIVAVRDANPSFPGFAGVVNSAPAPQTPDGPAPSLCLARRDFGARIVCVPNPEQGTKTVQVLLPRPAAALRGV